MKKIFIPALLWLGITNAADLSIFPINKAKFLAGTKFDLLIQCDKCKDPNIDIQVNGVPATKFFKKEVKLYEDNGTKYYRINEASFEKAGNFKVSAKSDGTSKYVDYNVVTTTSKSPKKAKNVILYIGDGMSLQAKQMARILSKGIVEGKYNGLLEMENLENMALITTSGYDSLTTDSANSASAYATGHKSVVGAMGVYADNTKDALDDPKVENISEILQRTKNMSIGLVTTSSVTDATPAAMVSHTRDRGEQNFIALDMLRLKPEVILGGGLRYFLPKEDKDSKRTDSNDLLKMFKEAGYELSFDKNDLEKIASKNPKKILGLYNLNHMNVYLDREVLKNKEVLGRFDAEPNLMQMTKNALNILSKNKNGFFLMVEGASIDKQLHAMDWQRSAYDAIEFDKAVGLGKEFAKKNGDTLIIVVADHAHGASITGTYHEMDGKSGREAVRTYQDSTFPTFEDKDGDGFPDNPDPEVTLAVQFANHPDYNASYRLREKPDPINIQDSKGKNIANPAIKGEFYKGNIPMIEDQETHAADDVVLMSGGVGSEYFKGVMDNTEVFFGIMQALGINPTK